MFKSPNRSKSRLREILGGSATKIAEMLFDCAYEDLINWPGPICLAPASTADRNWTDAHGCRADLTLLQNAGNLGERINGINEQLLLAGHARQIYIGIDCPTLDLAYVHSANDALAKHNAVLGPAVDGGVVLMGINDAWPPLAKLPWSTAQLMEALRSACTDDVNSVAVLEAHSDIDNSAELVSLLTALEKDPRPARRRLSTWLRASEITAKRARE